MPPLRDGSIPPVLVAPVVTSFKLPHVPGGRISHTALVGPLRQESWWPPHFMWRFTGVGVVWVFVFCVEPRGLVNAQRVSGGKLCDKVLFLPEPGFGVIGF